VMNIAIHMPIIIYMIKGKKSWVTYSAAYALASKGSNGVQTELLVFFSDSILVALIPLSHVFFATRHSLYSPALQ